MAFVLTRKAVLPVSLVVFGLLALFAPITFVQSAIVLAIGIMVPTMVLMLWKPAPATVAEVLHQANAPRVNR